MALAVAAMCMFAACGGSISATEDEAGAPSDASVRGTEDGGQDGEAVDVQLPGVDATADDVQLPGVDATADAGSDAVVQDAVADVGDAAPDMDVGAPPVGDAGADPSTLCPDIDSVALRCLPVACAQAIAAECVSVLAPAFSAAYAQALHQCAPTLSCSDRLDPAGDCVTPLIRAAAPTPAQMTLAEDFCQACAMAPATTQGGLSCVGHVVPPGSTGRMLPTSLLSLSDAYAAKVYAAGCIQAAVQQYPSNYDNCENTFLNCIVDQLPPDPGACISDAGAD